MRALAQILQIAFTYVGTVIGAGFASGQEVLQFFTRYGWMATITIGISTLLFIAVGLQLMLLAHERNTDSYEDLARHLFGERQGKWISSFTLVILFGISTVMLAGAGSVFRERFGLHYETGLIVTLVLACLVLIRGLPAIMAVNTFVVPVMAVLIVSTVVMSADSPRADNWLTLDSDYPSWQIWLSPFLYSAFNLSTSQAVLVPLGAQARSRKTILFGGLLGGVGIGALLVGIHFSLSARMPGISQFEVPMGQLAEQFGHWFAAAFSLVIFGEIFTTLIADVYGLSLQLRGRFGWRPSLSVPGLLLACYVFSHIGFSALLSVLYPLFGAISLVWLLLMLGRRRSNG
ncbi:hypothetical protein ACFQWB_12110 [Paenibacillus thermoaerophilus]|uniref:Membrane protein YkvI n=1 Tax=Paenibacillus thermoaerophilus TaxID=1215385 RepID=A0ABW2V3I2_9BACL|nr:hypothetical protein [Paenibacillus thermoaerophilus]TMV11978.1 hypothetical protein FE781_12300 [Paenibacillus thermoaerophilus]